MENLSEVKNTNKKTLGGIVKRVEQQEKFFNKKALLDTLSYSDKIIGREKQAEELVTYLLGYKKGFVVYRKEPQITHFVYQDLLNQIRNRKPASICIFCNSFELTI